MHVLQAKLQQIVALLKLKMCKSITQIRKKNMPVRICNPQNCARFSKVRKPIRTFEIAHE